MVPCSSTIILAPAPLDGDDHQYPGAKTLPPLPHLCNWAGDLTSLCLCLLRYQNGANHSVCLTGEVRGLSETVY